ncbi:NirD/YgiW/YdeI family stress tolerance protein [Parasulfitobacter algicola]|uniref:NirD/YgiW/YdeI family stress tolerance protein n=1 Tax=Parasulfitobacter algicola TaxID=2614809 RepID=A0ABX2IVA8_9RHOB|nr:NirD/YgiW/YdeI family stress tolerance protein [Sulfitobacter algicola]NSX54772.1 NirD/YgiW/YdeI family stress tolerance protein [Sulfitobacter algicola]
MKTLLIATTALLLPITAVFADITPIGDLKRNSNVTVSGTIDRLLDEDEFRMSDDTGSVKVYIGPNIVPANAGDQVTVTGFVDDDLRLEIYARQMQLPSGETVSFDRNYE